ncbi:MAG: FHA domain-containing protein, partial [Actinomycetota bacterium]
MSQSFERPITIAASPIGTSPAGHTRTQRSSAAGAGGGGERVLVWPAGEVPIGDAAIVIGRSKHCDISLADGNVSRRHAEFGR